jgi:predicted Zn-dependent protease
MAANNHSALAFQYEDYKEALFWLAALWERWPEDCALSITYANVLRTAGEPKRAFAIPARN